MTAKILVLLATLTAAETCEDGNFTAPQPEGAKDLKSIPARLHGKYESLEDSTLLEIADQVIVRYNTDISTLGESDMKADEWEKMHRDTTFFMDHARYVLKPFGDSIKLTVNYADTLFIISRVGVLRKYQGYYFLSTLMSENEWDVIKVEPGKNELVLSKITSNDDVEFLRSQLKTSDTTKVFSPTKAQFKQFVKEGGFRSPEKFRKQ